MTTNEWESMSVLLRHAGEVCEHIYMTTHVSELKDKEKGFIEAWSVGQKIREMTKK